MIFSNPLSFGRDLVRGYRARACRNTIFRARVVQNSCARVVQKFVPTWCRFAAKAAERRPLCLSIIDCYRICLVLASRQDGDDSIHRRAEVALRPLNAPARARCKGLVPLIEFGVEAAIVNERSRMRKSQGKSPGLSAVAVSAFY